MIHIFAGVLDTGNASFAGVNDTGNACNAGIVDAGDKTSEPLPGRQIIKGTIRKTTSYQ
jgi:hypothetical protein